MLYACFCPIFHICIMYKRYHFYLVLLQENPFFYCLDHIWTHLLVSKISTGGSTDVGRVHMKQCYIFVLCSIDVLWTRGRNHFYLVLLQENPFLYCLEQIRLNLIVSQIPTGESTYVGMECMDVIHFLRRTTSTSS
jgi:hypothetical protein